MSLFSRKKGGKKMEGEEDVNMGQAKEGHEHENDQDQEQQPYVAPPELTVAQQLKKISEQLVYLERKIDTLLGNRGGRGGGGGRFGGGDRGRRFGNRDRGGDRGGNFGGGDRGRGGDRGGNFGGSRRDWPGSNRNDHATWH